MSAVYRATLKTADEFQSYINSIGAPRFAICEEEPRNFLREDEWLFSDDYVILLKDVFSWNENGCSVYYKEPTKELQEFWGAEMTGDWNVLGLPEYFQDAFRWADVPDADASIEIVEEYFFKTVFQGDYGFFSLDVSDCDSFLKSWAVEDDKKSNPEKYRAVKKYGVVTDCFGSRFGDESMEYGLTVGENGYGRVTTEDLKRSGIKESKFVGMSCVVNGLNEVEMLGGVKILRSNEPSPCEVVVQQTLF